MNNIMKNLKLVAGMLLLFLGINAQTSPILWYTCAEAGVVDKSGNGYNGELKGSADIRSFGNKSVLYTVVDEGYV